MKNKLLFSLMLVCVALFVYHGAALGGITGKVAGVIKDAASGEPLPAVNVVIEGTTLGGATDNEGYYFIINIPPGTYSLQASMVGYTVESKTGIIVSIDHTTPVDFGLRVTAIAGEEVTVTAEREIIPMDISASQIVAEAGQIVEVPMITDISQYISLQAGIEGDYIRGGGLDQTEFFVDGLMVVDNRANKPMMMVNLSAVRELNIIKGGFNPEYGNVRSGLINVITKEGSPSIYHGSIDFRYSPPRYKHSGDPITNPNNFYLRPFLDEDVCYVGTENGTWDKETRESYPSFVGWNAVSEYVLSDDDALNDRTPSECRDFFMWQHACEGSGALGQKEIRYGHRPDWNVDASFGGPVPYIGGYLGNLSFFVSHRTNLEMFGLPTCRDYFREQNTNFKLTTRLSASMKLTFDALYGEMKSVANVIDSTPSMDDFISSGQAILYSPLTNSGPYGHRGPSNLYWPSSLSPFDTYRFMEGISFDHVLSPRTFYNVRISHVRTKNHATGHDRMRDPTIIKYIGNTPVDETPWGFEYRYGYETSYDGMLLSGVGGDIYDESKLNTLNFKFDLTSQVDKYNQVKMGFMWNYDDIKNHYWIDRLYNPVGTRHIRWSQFPYRMGAYVQDKLEFEGMIANFGVRVDVNEPNCDWYTVDPFSKFFGKKYVEVFTQLAPKEPTKGQVKVSPRLGISHPISEDAKLYFNYGHFYSMPSSNSMYNINYSTRGVTSIGNPSANIPKTVSYELGVEYNVRDMFLIHLAGYYKDVNDQTGSISVRNFDNSVSYSTTVNNMYVDTRGFELRIDKRFGRWITGWFNYNYMVTSSGYYGERYMYEDVRQQALAEMQNPVPSTPRARPVARANVNIRTPGDFGPGPVIGGNKILGDIHLSTLYTWRAGGYMTWDPLDTYELASNLQWKGETNVDQRISKRFRFGKYTAEIFADINNLFNLKYINTRGFQNSTDSENYYKSLHLPMYGDPDEDYESEGMIAGNDKLGDVWSEDKPYINMPDREFLTYLNQRYVFFGFRINF